MRITPKHFQSLQRLVLSTSNPAKDTNFGSYFSQHAFVQSALINSNFIQKNKKLQEVRMKMWIRFCQSPVERLCPNRAGH